MRVAVCGIDNHDAPFEYRGIRIYPFSSMSRVSLKRILRSWIVVYQALRLKADVYVIHTPELILPAIVFLPLRKVVYDVHEDYFQNILSGGVYPSWMRKRLAYWVRKMEQYAAPKIAGITVAEQVFYPIFSKQAKRTIVLQNKFLLPDSVEITHNRQVNRVLKFVLTGNLTEWWGLFRAIYLFQRVAAVEESHLTIVGYCPQPAEYHQAVKLIQELGLSERICWIGGLHYVDYQIIIKNIAQADVGFALYESIPNIVTRIPTKFFEYLACHTPLIFTDSPEWHSFAENSNLGFSSAEFERMLSEDSLRAHLQRFQNQRPADKSFWSWESEATAMNAFYSEVFRAVVR